MPHSQSVDHSATVKSCIDAVLQSKDKPYYFAGFGFGWSNASILERFGEDLDQLTALIKQYDELSFFGRLWWWLIKPSRQQLEFLVELLACRSVVEQATAGAADSNQPLQHTVNVLIGNLTISQDLRESLVNFSQHSGWVTSAQPGNIGSSDDVTPMPVFPSHMSLSLALSNSASPQPQSTTVPPQGQSLPGRGANPPMVIQPVEISSLREILGLSLTSSGGESVAAEAFLHLDNADMNAIVTAERLLGIGQAALANEVNRAFNRKCVEVHPDKIFNLFVGAREPHKALRGYLFNRLQSAKDSLLGQETSWWPRYCLTRELVDLILNVAEVVSTKEEAKLWFVQHYRQLSFTEFYCQLQTDADHPPSALNKNDAFAAETMRGLGELQRRQQDLQAGQRKQVERLAELKDAFFEPNLPLADLSHDTNPKSPQVAAPNWQQQAKATVQIFDELDALLEGVLPAEGQKQQLPVTQISDAATSPANWQTQAAEASSTFANLAALLDGSEEELPIHPASDAWRESATHALDSPLSMFDNAGNTSRSREANLRGVRLTALSVCQ